MSDVRIVRRFISFCFATVIIFSCTLHVYADQTDIGNGTDEKREEIKEDVKEKEVKLEKRKVVYVLLANPQFVFPVDDLSGKAEIGFGVSISFRAQNLFVPDYFLGFSLHYFNFDGKDNYKQLTMIPLVVTTGYGIPFGVGSFKPLVRFGATFNSFLRYKDSAKKQYGRHEVFLPIIMVGAYFDFHIAERYLLQIGGDFGNIFEEKRNLCFFVLTAGVGIRLVSNAKAGAKG